MPTQCVHTHTTINNIISMEGSSNSGHKYSIATIHWSAFIRESQSDLLVPNTFVGNTTAILGNFLSVSCLPNGSVPYCLDNFCAFLARVLSIFCTMPAACTVSEYRFRSTMSAGEQSFVCILPTMTTFCPVLTKLAKSLLFENTCPFLSAVCYVTASTMHPVKPLWRVLIY